MNKTNKTLFGIFLRYLIILLIALPNLFLFYFIFTPLTIYPVYYLSKLFFDSSVSGNMLSINNNMTIELIGACIAGSAYYLLLILNLSTPNIKIKKRLSMILLSFLVFLIVNILRIFILILMLSLNLNFFDITHKIFWYSVSTILVLGIWLFEIKLFKIKEIPVYSDIKYLFKFIKK